MYDEMKTINKKIKVIIFYIYLTADIWKQIYFCIEYYSKGEMDNFKRNKKKIKNLQKQ